MAKSPDKPRDPAKHSKKDPAKPTRAKAARPELAPIAPALEKLLNPGIDAGTAGPGSQTGLTPPAGGSLKPPPDNSWDRRADFARAHTARKSTPKEFAERPQSGYVAKTGPGELDPDLAKALGIEEDDQSPPLPSPPPQGGREQAERDESAEIFSQRSLRTKRTSVPEGIAGIASQTALDRLLREGRPEFTEKPWVPHRPPRPEKSEGGQQLVIKSDFKPQGDQPQAINELVEGVQRHDRMQVLLGVTGSGKTYTMAKVIEATQRPALILAPNKTLAAQLYGEFKSFFPDNAVEYFVSYYDYYQPEAYVPRTDTYIEKESSINEQIDRMRHSATRALLERDDVVIVASVSCIYGIGSVETYSAMTFALKQGER